MSSASGTATEIAPADAHERVRHGTLLIDVRDAQELLGGRAEGAVHVARCDLERRISELASDRAQELLLICASGRRSQIAATQLAELGYAHARSVSGGF